MGVKKNRNKRVVLPVIMIVLFCIIAILVVFVVYINSQNYLVYENVLKSIDNDMPTSADVILVNDVVVGGVSNNKWIDAKNMFDKFLVGIDNVPVKMYSIDGASGTYYTSMFKKQNDVYYTKTTKENIVENYVAVGNETTNSTIGFIQQTEVNETDIKMVKKALGMYRLFNATINVTEAYDVNLKENENGRILFVTSKGKNIFGVYSAVVYYNANNVELIKYSYAKDKTLSTSWPVYSMIDVLNIDGDTTNELVMQETTATAVRYSILEYMNNEFYQVMQVEVKI